MVKCKQEKRDETRKLQDFGYEGRGLSLKLFCLSKVVVVVLIIFPVLNFLNVPW